MSLQAKFQTASAEYQKMQADLSNLVESRQILGAKLAENDLVKKEFAQLAPDNVVYKQIGPVLVKQDQAEAKSNVDTRLDFIRNDIKRVEGQLQELQAQSEKKKNELVEIQTALQQGAPQPAQPAPGPVSSIAL